MAIFHFYLLIVTIYMPKSSTSNMDKINPAAINDIVSLFSFFKVSFISKRRIVYNGKN